MAWPKLRGEPREVLFLDAEPQDIFMLEIKVIGRHGPTWSRSHGLVPVSNHGDGAEQSARGLQGFHDREKVLVCHFGHWGQVGVAHADREHVLLDHGDWSQAGVIHDHDGRRQQLRVHAAAVEDVIHGHELRVNGLPAAIAVDVAVQGQEARVDCLIINIVVGVEVEALCRCDINANWRRVVGRGKGSH